MHNASHNSRKTPTEILFVWLQGQTIEVPDVKEESGSGRASALGVSFLLVEFPEDSAGHCTTIWLLQISARPPRHCVGAALQFDPPLHFMNL
jgi:hypothetical protein